MHDSNNLSDLLNFCLIKASGDAQTGVQSRLRLVGEVDIRVYAPDGSLRDQRLIHNLVVNTGLTHVRDLLKDKTTVTEMQWMAVGSGTTAPAATDTDLQTEITTGLGGNRVSITRSNSGSFGVLYSSTWTPGQATNGAITEAGIFNAQPVGPASGTMLARSTFSPIAKAAGDTLMIGWTITISAS